MDKLCVGASQFGGRWNPIGIPALYCGTSIALCALEKFVHIDSGMLPPQVLVAVDVPDDCTIAEPGISALPPGWDDMPTSSVAQSFGGAWLAHAGQLALKVPSAIVPEENNLILNPHHHDYARVALTVIRSFVFDKRMYK
ncbi:RES family NAD+ phosphorylase [Massilia sp. P8910]|uniref:RES family NAD+ phosphorylase n=2 Tax=Massilia antarctica TaxID=2765360 RepID=A0AA48WAR0_9BURK|nr:RES family NAD+ phosphorylase [Massilia antarctica]QPI48253.1 RES family NAD+ phosphorylase [Massilia antarctica]